MRRALLAALAALALAAPASAAPTLVKVGDFHAPVDIAAPAGDPRVFVVDQDGKVIVVDPDGTRKTFLDLTATTAQGEEQGLLSIAFAPDYARSGVFFVYQVLAADNSLNVVRYRVSATDPDAADPASRHVVVTIPHTEAQNHNGGMLQFGPDGMLYTGTGDGGNSYDTPTRDAQDPNSRLGKILRIDPATDAVSMYALGVRNPWRWSFDTNGDMWIGDVGQSAREEVDVLRAGTPAGANLGWVCWEGNAHTQQGGADVCNQNQFDVIVPRYVAPVASLNHSDGWVAITGGVVVHDPQVPSLDGRYVFGDIGKPDLFSTPAAAPGAIREETALRVANADTFGEDACGRVYVGADPGYAHSAGSVYRIEETEPSVCRTTAPPPADRTPCTLALHVIAHQHVLRARRFALRLAANEPCTVTVSSTRLRPRTLRLARSTPRTLRLVVSRKLLASLRRHRSVAVRVRLASVDAAGNRATLVRRLRARR